MSRVSPLMTKLNEEFVSHILQETDPVRQKSILTTIKKVLSLKKS